MGIPMQAAQAEVARTLFTLRLVFGAMIVGVVLFGAVVLLVLRPEPAAGDTTVLLGSLAVLGASLIVAWVVVNLVLRQGLRTRLAELPHDEAPAVMHRGFFTISLAGGAMGEAYCFFAMVVYMLTASPLALLAAAVGLLALLAQMPTADRFHHFFEELHGHRPA